MISAPPESEVILQHGKAEAVFLDEAEGDIHDIRHH